MNNDQSILSLKEVAAELEISADTLRNWQRLGVIEKNISRWQIATIKEQLTRRGRLASRANKLYKEGQGKKTQDYELSLSEAHRNREGIYYTPDDIAQNMMSTIPCSESLAHKKFLDPCCGTGNFMVEALRLGFAPENIYGYDIDPKAITIARRRVRGAKIKCADFLEVSQRLRTKFDYIYTNPPWGKHLSEELRRGYTTFFDTPQSADTSAIFFVASYRLLAEGGRIGFLVQEAIFNIGVYEWLRERMLRLKIVCLKDYGRAFKGLLTGAQGVVIENSEAKEGDECCCYRRRKADIMQIDMRKISSFSKNHKRVMNFWASTQDMECIDAIYARPHKTLQGASRWGLGIVTGDNRTHCHKTPTPEALIGALRGCDIHKGSIDEPSLFINGDIERYQQSASREIYEAREKLIYKFISSKLVFYADHKQRYPLNSANCVVVDSGFGATHSQIAELLNSDVMNWVFSTIYRSYKILRGDIETLPLHIGYFDEYDKFSEESYCRYLGIEKEENGGYKVCFYQQQ